MDRAEAARCLSTMSYWKLEPLRAQPQTANTAASSHDVLAQVPLRFSSKPAEALPQVQDPSEESKWNTRDQKLPKWWKTATPIFETSTGTPQFGTPFSFDIPSARSRASSNPPVPSSRRSRAVPIRAPVTIKSLFVTGDEDSSKTDEMTEIPDNLTKADVEEAMSRQSQYEERTKAPSAKPDFDEICFRGPKEVFHLIHSADTQRYSPTVSPEEDTLMEDVGSPLTSHAIRGAKHQAGENVPPSHAFVPASSRSVSYNLQQQTGSPVDRIPQHLRKSTIPHPRVSSSGSVSGGGSTNPRIQESSQVDPSPQAAQPSQSPGKPSDAEMARARGRLEKQRMATGIPSVQY
ncbi:MAG: hypothetical protein M1825_002637 [Sarcosagium campestre]|nr:MAG: hypothetical protein M1825_002637 [Sarcosagium campestre]